MIYHPIFQINNNNLPSQNQLQPQNNLNKKGNNVIDRETKKEKFG